MLKRMFICLSLLAPFSHASEHVTTIEDMPPPLILLVGSYLDVHPMILPPNEPFVYLPDQVKKAGYRDLRLAMIQHDVPAFQVLLRESPYLSLPYNAWHESFLDVVDIHIATETSQKTGIFTETQHRFGSFTGSYYHWKESEHQSKEHVECLTMHAFAGSRRAQQLMVQHLRDAPAHTALIFATIPHTFAAQTAEALEAFFKTMKVSHETVPAQSLADALKYARQGSANEQWQRATTLLMTHQNPYALELCLSQNREGTMELIREQAEKLNPMAMHLRAAILQYIPPWAFGFVRDVDYFKIFIVSKREELLTLVQSMPMVVMPHAPT